MIHNKAKSNLTEKQKPSTDDPCFLSTEVAGHSDIYLENRQANIEGHESLCAECLLEQFFVAMPKDRQRFSYPAEIDPGLEPERLPEIEFSNFILWRKLWNRELTGK